MREQYNHCEMVKETDPRVLHTELYIDRSINQSINQSGSMTAETRIACILQIATLQTN